MNDYEGSRGVGDDLKHIFTLKIVVIFYAFEFQLSKFGGGMIGC